MIPQTSNKVNSEHLKQLNESGITDLAFIEKMGLYSAMADELRGLFRRSDLQSGGLVFPYPFVEGFKRVRLDAPIISTDNDGYGGKPDTVKEIRYLGPKGQNNHLYLPLPEEELSKESRLLITEGEKKTLSLVQAGFPAVGVAGVWSWRIAGGVCPEFEMINWNRPVTIIFDSDAAYRRTVRSALQALAVELSKRGAKVHVALSGG